MNEILMDLNNLFFLYCAVHINWPMEVSNFVRTKKLKTEETENIFSWHKLSIYNSSWIAALLSQ